MEHSHHFGVSSGQRIHAGQNLSIVVPAEESIDQVLQPGESVSIQIDGQLESLVANALVNGVPTGDCLLTVGGEEFDLQRGPFQWHRNGHHRAEDFTAVDFVTVENIGEEPARVMALAGFSPTETADE